MRPLVAQRSDSFAVDGDAIVVLFSQDAIRGSAIISGPVHGVRVQFGEFAGAILGPGSHHFEDVLAEATLEIVEPHEPGERLQGAWADRPCAELEAVLWRPDASAVAHS